MRSAYSLREIINSLNGYTSPVGESNEDSYRYTNLENLIELIDELLGEIEYIADMRYDHKASYKKAGKLASEFLDSLYEKCK